MNIEKGDYIVKYYIDESGNTGTQNYSDNWNFESQPYFVYCALEIDDKNVVMIENELNNLLNSKQIVKELKSAKKGHMKLKDTLIKELIDILEKYKYEFYIEVVNKKFQISNYIIDYCVLPYYDIPAQQSLTELKQVKLTLANLLYREISDCMLSDFLSLINKKEYDANDLLTYLNSLKNSVQCNLLCKHIEETIDSVSNYKERGLKLENIYPLIDTYKGGYTKCSVSPNIDSMNNLISRFMERDNDIKIVHDVQKELEPALRKWVEERNSLEDTKDISIEFIKSEESRIIQCVDYFAGNIRVAIQQKIQGLSNYNDIIDNIIENRCNFVSTVEEQMKLFPNNYCLKQLKGYIDKI